MYQDHYFAVSVKLNFCYRQTHYINDQDKVQSVKDTDNEFTDTKEKAPINWHFTCQLTRIYENFKEKHFRSIQSARWLLKIQSLILVIRIIWKRNWMTWLGRTRQCKENWKQRHIQIKSKFLPWYLINGLECTVRNILMSLSTLFELHMKSKK